MRAAAETAWIVESPLTRALAFELNGIAEGDELAAQWIVRVVFSLLYWPVADPAAEQEMVRRFLGFSWAAAV